MNANGQDATKSRKLKTIIVTAVAAVVIILVGFWALTSAINSGKAAKEVKTAEISKTEDKTIGEQVGTEPTSPASQYTAAPETTETAPAQTTTPAANMPTTGPVEVLFSAIALGIVVYLVSLNVTLVKENR